MRISVKGRYALAAMLYMTQKNHAATPVAVLSIAEALGISKIYLEQVFSLLKRTALVTSIKGAQGGYRLAAPPEQIPVYAILAATESSLIEKTQATVAEKSPGIDAVLQSCVFSRIDRTLRQDLSAVTLADLAAELDARQKENAYMYFI